MLVRRSRFERNGRESRPSGPSTRLSSPAFTLSLRQFLATEAGSGLLLVGATVLALLWANSPWSDSYERLWSTEAGIRVGSAELVMDLRHWVDDGLMALFFWWWVWR